MASSKLSAFSHTHDTLIRVIPKGSQIIGLVEWFGRGVVPHFLHLIMLKGCLSGVKASISNEMKRRGRFDFG